eukprot:1273185-Rhodomonas_salina.2
MPTGVDIMTSNDTPGQDDDQRDPSTTPITHIQLESSACVHGAARLGIRVRVGGPRLSSQRTDLHAPHSRRQRCDALSPQLPR